MYFQLEENNMFEAIATIGERGQITLPKNIRTIKGLKNKDRVLIKIENEKIIVEKMQSTQTQTQSKEEIEVLMKEYYIKYGKENEKEVREWDSASKEANEMIDDDS